MRKPKIVGGAFVLLAIVFVVAIGFVIEYLWNNLMPAILGLPTIGYWQALGLLVLSRILFGGHGGWRRMRRARFARGWNNLTPEERERFRQAMGNNCG